MPPVCLFSPLNHPPRRDFIGHLPYSAGDSARLHDRVQGYSFWVSGANGQPIQVGVSPDRTKDQAIMFGYAFDSRPARDRADPKAEPYRHPQSFYFSGYPLPPAERANRQPELHEFRHDQAGPEDDLGSGEQARPEDAPRVPALLTRSTPRRRRLGAQRAPTWGDLVKAKH